MDSHASSRQPVPLLFLHHSCGGQLLADPGPSLEEGGPCLYRSHPNGGGLRGQLEARGFAVHQASYGSQVGGATDLLDWAAKFRTQLPRMLATERNDRLLPLGQRNAAVIFKSCFPNNAFVGEGQSPGDPVGPALTVWNARAALAAVRAELARYPGTLFVYMTAPPEAPMPAPAGVVRRMARRLLGRADTPATRAARGARARAFNAWVVSPEGWLAGYPQRNLVVFDYFGLLTRGQASGLSAYATGGGTDGHPSAEGNQLAARVFVPFLEQALAEAGLRPAA